MRWLLAFVLTCRNSVNRRNAAQLLALALHSQATLKRWREDDYERKIVYARLDQQLRVAAMVDIVGYDDAVDARRLESMRRQALETLPQAADYAAAVEWAGMRPATPTGVPIVGASAYRNLWLNLGHGALGFTLACGSGERLARMLC